MSSASQISPEVSLSCHPQVIYTSSAGHLHVVCTSSAARFQPQNISSQRAETALLKIERKNIHVRNKYFIFTNFRAHVKVSAASALFLFFCNCAKWAMLAIFVFLYCFIVKGKINSSKKFTSKGGTLGPITVGNGIVLLRVTEDRQHDSAMFLVSMSVRSMSPLSL